jgi:oxalate decarboxylase/phosphoglucose isomerase-like protein (cupin superfamily)
MSLFDNISEPEKKYIWIWKEILPKWAYTDEEWNNMVRNPSNTYVYEKIEIPKETTYYGY